MMTTALETKCVVLMDARMSVWTPYPRNQVNTRFNTTGPCLAHGNRGEGVPCPYPVPLSRFPPLFLLASISWRFSIANYYTMLSNIFLLLAPRSWESHIPPPSVHLPSPFLPRSTLKRQVFCVIYRWLPC